MIFLTPISDRLPPQFKSYHIFIDTNFLIDAFLFSDSFKDLIFQLKQNDCTFVTLDAVNYEFTQGSKSIENYRKKIQYYDQIIDSTIPTDRTIVENVGKLSKVLLNQSKSISYVDALLLGAIMKFRTKTLLLSKDRSDVPISMFEIKASLAIYAGDHNCVFSFYDFNEGGYKKRMEEILSPKNSHLSRIKG